MATRSLGLAALLLIVPALAKEQPISAVVSNAKYVMVTSPSGDNFSPNISAEDRQAVKDVQAAIGNWGRYKLVYKRQEADLILLVRTGRTASVEGGVQVGTNSGSNRVSGRSIGGEAGNPEDTLEVYSTSQREGSPLWRGSEPQGLILPQMKLVKQFRLKVESAAMKP